MGLHPERPRTPARCSGRLRTYRPRGRPPSGSGTARSSGPSGLRKGGGAGNPSQRGTQRNRKGSPRWTETTSRSHGPVRQSEGSEADGAARGTFCAVGGVQTPSRDSCCKWLLARSQVRRLLSAWGTGFPRLRWTWASTVCGPHRLAQGRLCAGALVSVSRLGMCSRLIGTLNAEGGLPRLLLDVGASRGFLHFRILRYLQSADHLQFSLISPDSSPELQGQAA